MEMPVDQARHREFARRFDYVGVFGFRQRARSNRCNCPVDDYNIRARVLAVLGVKREDMRIADQGLHDLLLNRLPQRAALTVSTLAQRKASHTAIDTVS